MCATSMIGDFYTDRWKDQWPIHPGGVPIYPGVPTYPGAPAPGPYITDPSPNPLTVQWPQVTKQEFDDLKKEVETMKALLIRAKIYDEETGQQDCEMDEKIALLKKIADLVGVSLEEVFGQK